MTPSTLTTDVDTKLLPVTVRVSGPLPATALVGLILVSVGTAGGAVTVSVAPDVPPPGAGEKTVIVCVPALATSLAKIKAVSCVADPYVVVRLLPSTCTTDPFTKPVPPTASVKAALPPTTLVGLILVSVGTTFGGAVTVRVAPLDVPPPASGRRP